MNKTIFQRLIHVAIDILIYVGSIELVLWANPFTIDNSMEQWVTILYAVGFAFVSCMCLFLTNGYSVYWRYAVAFDYMKITAGSAMAAVANYVILNNLPGQYDDKALNIILASLLAFALVCIHRLVWGVLAKREEEDPALKIGGNIMVIGAGEAGSLLIRDIMFSRSRLSGGRVVCIIDDDPEKQGQTLSGVKIVGTRHDLVAAAKKYKVNSIVFAVPSCSAKDRAEILNLCQKTGCDVRILPGIDQLVDMNISIQDVRQVQIEDLLGREPIDINLEKVMAYVEGETVLVTGGGGSIGSELCRQIATHKPRRLLIFDIYENNAYDILNELKRAHPDLDVLALIGSVRDSKRLNQVFADYHPTLVYHAAAHKHVPLMEDSPNEAIKNNVFGTLKLAQTADRYGVKTFVLISTDKAVNPTNIMGASKRICEMIVQSFSRRSETRFVAVRFGNVLGSNGSVIPLFSKQIAEGGPVTVTDPNIIRYFMTIPEAVSLVLQAGAQAHGGEIFVLDMGEPVRILDLAENMIRLSGYTPYEDMPIVFTGLRPGEKLYEELLMDEEGLQDTENKLIHIGKPLEFDDAEFARELEQLRDRMYDDHADIRDMVQHIVPTYHYSK